MRSETLIQSIIEQTNRSIEKAEKLKTYEPPMLNWREHPGSWSILECLEHLNLYGDHYLPEMEASIKNHSSNHEPVFKSGILGKYFAESMLPKEKLNKMKTFKDKNPLNSMLGKTSIERFINQQIKFLDILDQSRKVSLNKVRIKTSISSLVRLKLGDTFQFITNHNLRHLKQIERIEKAQNTAGMPT